MTRLVAVGIALLALAPLARAEDGKLSLTVKETAGIRRFGYPVYAKLSLPREATQKDRFRLLSGGKPVAAQFRTLKDDKKAVALDFTLSCAPLEKKTLTVEYGEKVTAGPEPKGGMKLEEKKGVYTVRSGGMAYVIDPAVSFLRSVQGGKKTYFWQPPSEDRSAITIVREGPLAVCVRKRVRLTTAKAKDKELCDLEMTFPRSKSWVECTLTVDEATADGKTLVWVIGLELDQKKTLVDFGAGSMVYTTLEKKQHAALVADDTDKLAWKVMRDDEPFVLPGPKVATKAEGWAHVMDGERCTAIAVDRFGEGGEDSITVSAAGEVQLTRTFGKKGKRGKTLRFWLHFVDVPVQVGALTSPQSMLAPLAVEVK
jgi:hypothetical protein